MQFFPWRALKIDATARLLNCSNRLLSLVFVMRVPSSLTL
jgi:hypothetical protein